MVSQSVFKNDVTCCNDELEALGLADNEGEKTLPLAEGLSMLEPGKQKSNHVKRGHLSSMLEFTFKIRVCW